MRLIAVDWSGAVIGAQHRIWLAEASEPGALDRLESGRTRLALTSHLRAELDHDPQVVVGLDFGFAFPAWFMRQLGVSSGPELWAHVAEHGERWLAECAPPFWGRAARPRPFTQDAHFRRTELSVPRLSGIAPKSMFQIGGAGSVGTGSIRGMPLLHALHTAGAHVWPFDPPGWPLVLEIYPRLLTGPVVKSHAPSRQSFLDQHYPAPAARSRGGRRGLGGCIRRRRLGAGDGRARRRARAAPRRARPRAAPGRPHLAPGGLRG